MKSIILAGVLATASISVNAGNFYVLGDIGQSKLEVNFDGVTGSKSKTMYDLGMGYGLNENFAFEIAYRDLGGISESDDYNSSSVDVTSLQLSALGKLPVGNNVYVYGRLGMARLNADATYKDFNYPEDNESGSESTTKALIGLGVGFNVNEAFGLRAEYIQHAKWEDVTFSSITVGATYSF